MKLRDLSQELFELGPRGTAFRGVWELRGRLGLTSANGGADLHALGLGAERSAWTRQLGFTDADSVRRSILPLSSSEGLRQLQLDADAVLDGTIKAFGRWPLLVGSPVAWHRHPITGESWDAGTDLSFSLRSTAGQGDVKLIWEAGRFPQAYLLARAAAFFPEKGEQWAHGLIDQIEHFQATNTYGLGVHWSSGQEVAVRLLAWLFSYDALLASTVASERARQAITKELIAGAVWIERHIDFARVAVYNNHLLAEAVALYGVGALLPTLPSATKWRATGKRLLEAEATRQFYTDGAYIQQSHNYHRVALHYLMWASMFARAIGDRPSKAWLRAMDLSLDFLVQHQNPTDGRLPNFGANDGSNPTPLSSCEFGDMRPTLQTVSIFLRGERLYDAGLWDEDAAWWLGPAALDAPLRKPERRSVSFAATGYHVLRDRDDQGTFAAFRCGQLRERFSQIDMLHLDVWWKGHNVLVDGGSFSYDAPAWHNYFNRTASHNALTVDGHDQMLHLRQFKVVYWTQAKLLAFEDSPRVASCAGEHYGYQRHPGGCIHRRSVTFLKDDTWIVADTVFGTGDHVVRLHWLCGDFPSSYERESATLGLQTPAGLFTIRTFDQSGRSLAGEVVIGQDDEPRGWQSRAYGVKVPVPSLAVTVSGALPVTILTIMSGVPYSFETRNSRWSIESTITTAGFDLEDGLMKNVGVGQVESAVTV